MNIALKEWAVVCRALAMGVQSILLRKGGIAEAEGEFRPEHSEFCLYPTFFHEQRNSIKPQYHSLFDALTPPDAVRITHAARVTGVRFLPTLEECLALDSQHILTESVVRQRFEYRRPGLFLMAVDVLELPTPIEFAETPAMAGCKSWVTIP